jgi:hypothetical protein
VEHQVEAVGFSCRSDLMGNELSDKIGQLKMPAKDGKMRSTDVADTEQLFRLVQSFI